MGLHLEGLCRPMHTDIVKVPLSIGLLIKISLAAPSHWRERSPLF